VYHEDRRKSEALTQLLTNKYRIPVKVETSVTISARMDVTFAARIRRSFQCLINATNSSTRMSSITANSSVWLCAVCMRSVSNS
jgi:uncharacterized PurR-regulated membrane protein YhhQ (DUF165 family)